MSFAGVASLFPRRLEWKQYRALHRFPSGFTWLDHAFGLHPGACFTVRAQSLCGRNVQIEIYTVLWQMQIRSLGPICSWGWGRCGCVPPGNWCLEPGATPDSSCDNSLHKRPSAPTLAARCLELGIGRWLGPCPLVQLVVCGLIWSSQHPQAWGDCPYLQLNLRSREGRGVACSEPHSW